MADGTAVAPGLALPRDTFARLTPVPFLHTHLKAGTRPSGRRPAEYRSPAINKGSLTHANGSAVVRLGDTAVVCGVRAETLLVSNIPNPPQEGDDPDDVIENLGLIVPNVELGTGCSPAHLPGNPPGSQAQSLTWRMNSLLQRIIHPEDLHISYTEPNSEDDIDTEGSRTITKAYWTLYVDVLCIALDGNAFDAMCLAAVAALQDTVLPHAWWDPDRETILCSPLASESHKPRLQRAPIACSFAIFSTATPLKDRSESQNWVLADPDSFEEECCSETVTVLLEYESGCALPVCRRLEKYGGSFVGKQETRQCFELAKERAMKFNDILKSA